MLIVADGTKAAITSFTTSRLLSQIIQNLTSTKAPNLKSNIFDKMLSDEILSIKKHFYEQDISLPSAPRATVSNAPTPTLEVKQNWPMKGFTKEPHYSELDQTAQKAHVKYRDGNKKEEQEKSSKENSKNEVINAENANVNEKVLGLRSLPDGVPHAYHSYVNRGDNTCTCIRTHPTACTNHYLAMNSKICSHTPKPCTSSKPINPVSPYYYATVQPYFVGVTQLPYINTYYHPVVINEMKIPKKTKRRKSTKTYIDTDLYYDEDDHISYSKKPKYDYYGSYEYTEKDSFTDDDEMNIIREERKNKRKKKRRKYKIDNFDTTESKKEKLVQNLFDDLKTYYSDSIVKDCYCSTWSSTSSNRYSPFILYFLCLINFMFVH